MRDKYLTPDAPASGFVCRTLRIPDGEEFLAAVNGALLELTYPWNWEEYGALTPDETAELFFTMYEDYRESRGCVIGTVFMHTLPASPSGSLPCSGGTFLRTDYPALYAAIDPLYHVDADNFRVPNMTGRFPLDHGGGFTMDQTGGTQTHTLSAAEMPSHTHVESAAAPAVGAALVGVPIPSAVPAVSSTGAAGGGAAHNNMPPYYVIKFSIWAR